MVGDAATRPTGEAVSAPLSVDAASVKPVGQSVNGREAVHASNMATLPIFDRLFREAVKRVRANNLNVAPIHEVSEVPLAFRSIFGHLM